MNDNGLSINKQTNKWCRVSVLFKATFAIQNCLLEPSGFSQLSSREGISCPEDICHGCCAASSCGYVVSTDCNSSPCLKFGAEAAVTSPVHHRPCHINSRDLLLDQREQVE